MYEVAAGYVRPNQVLDEAQTLARQKAAMDQVAPVMVTVREGDTVVQEGEIVTGQDLIVFKALGLTGSRSGWKIWLGVFLLVLLGDGDLLAASLPLQQGGRLPQQHEARVGLAPARGYRWWRDC